jgi:hypothetical protein
MIGFARMRHINRFGFSYLVFKRDALEEIDVIAVLDVLTKWRRDDLPSGKYFHNFRCSEPIKLVHDDSSRPFKASG